MDINSQQGCITPYHNVGRPCFLYISTIPVFWNRIFSLLVFRLLGMDLGFFYNAYSCPSRDLPSIGLWKAKVVRNTTHRGKRRSIGSCKRYYTERAPHRGFNVGGKMKTDRVYERPLTTFSLIPSIRWWWYVAGQLSEFPAYLFLFWCDKIIVWFYFRFVIDL